VNVRIAVVGVFLAAVVASAASPAAADRGGSWEKELYFGTYEPDPKLIDPVGTVGMRLFRVVTDPIAIGAEVGFINKTDIEFEIAPPDTVGTLEYRAAFVDASLRWSPIRFDRWVVSAFGGPGWTFVSGRVQASAGGRPEFVVDGLEADSFALFGGASVKWYFGQGFYLRLAGRYRWFEARDGEDYDRELTLALGL